MNKDDVLVGVLRSLAHSVSLLEVAAVSYAECSPAICFVLAVSAREELGRSNLLMRRARGMLPGETVDPAALRAELGDHLAKLRAGQTGVAVPMSPEWLEAWRSACADNDATRVPALGAELENVARRVRKREPRDAHERRQRAQYVDPQSDGSWSTPDVVTAEEACGAVMMTFAGVANTLIALQSDQDLSAILASGTLKVNLPMVGEFSTRVLSTMNRRGA